MEISIDRFRALAQQDSHKLVVNQDQQKLVTAKETLGTRLVQWVKGPNQDQIQSNRDTITKFHESLVKAYGEEIGSKISEKYLSRRYEEGKNLSSRTVKLALQDAKALRNSNMNHNMILQSSVLETLPKTFQKTTGRDFDTLTDRQKDTLYKLVSNTIGDDDLFVSTKMDLDEIGDLAKGAIRSFEAMQTRDMQTKFGALSKFLTDGGDSVSMEAIRAKIDEIFQLDEGIGEILRSSLSELEAGQELLSQTPLDQEGIDDVQRAIHEKIQVLNEKKDLLGELGGMNDAMIQDIDNTIARLQEHSDYIGGFTENDSLSQTNVKYVLDMWENGAGRVLGYLFQQAQQDGNLELGDRYLEAMDHVPPPPIQEGEDRVENAGQMEKDYIETLKNYLKQVQRENGQDPSVISKLLNEQHVEALNRDGEWNVIQSRLDVPIGENTHSITSKVIPGKHIGPTLEKSYMESGINGISSQSGMESEHAMNLAKSEIRDKDGKLIIDFMRLGVCSAKGLPSGSEQRIQANFNRAKEAIIGDLESDPEFLQNIIDNPDQKHTMDVGSISLQTAIRKLPIVGGEKEMVFDQVRAYEMLNEQGQPIELNVIDPRTGEEKTIRVHLDCTCFCFGVNPGAVRFGAGHGEVESLNQAGLEKMFGSLDPSDRIGGKIGEYLKTNPENAPQIRELVRQLRQMWSDGSYKDAQGDVYKFAARLSVLGRMCNIKININCMSGKDRTGHLDAEIKMLATEIYFTGVVPLPGRLSTGRQDTFRQFALRSGNLEMQRYNTGFAGYKTGNVSYNTERLGTEEAKRLYRGGSKFVHN